MDLSVRGGGAFLDRRRSLDRRRLLERGSCGGGPSIVGGSLIVELEGAVSEAAVP